MKAVLFHENKTVDYGKGPIVYESGHTYLFRRDKADRWIRRGAAAEVKIDVEVLDRLTEDPAGQHYDPAFMESLHRRFSPPIHSDDFAEAMRLAGKTTEPPTIQPPATEAPANDKTLDSAVPVAATDGGDSGQRPVHVAGAGRPMPRPPSGGRGNSRK